LKKLISYIFKLFGLKIVKIGNSDNNPILLWKLDNEYQNIYNSIKTQTLLDELRCYIIYQVLNQIKNIDGDIAEIGVYKGGTAKLISLILQNSNKVIYLLDTFMGMPEVDPKKDLHHTGDFSDASLEMVKNYLINFKNIKIVQGIFPETEDQIKSKLFSFVHIDVDIYQSVLDCCKYFYPRMNKNGIIIFDDYGFKSCPGAKKAVDEFMIMKSEKIIYLPTGQCILIKK
jgi:O-methyltransferase